METERIAWSQRERDRLRVLHDDVPAVSTPTAQNTTSRKSRKRSFLLYSNRTFSLCGDSAWRKVRRKVWRKVLNLFDSVPFSPH